MAVKEWTTEELVAALHAAGPVPDLDLLRACLARAEDLAPHLLEMLATTPGEGADLPAPMADPRAAAVLHAGHLLLAFKEPAALPLFVEIYRDEGRQTLLEWFTPWLHEYGAMAVPPFAGLVQDRTVHWYGRAAATEVLSKIGRRFPATRQNVISALRHALPAERPALPAPSDAGTLSAGIEQDPIWSWALRALSELGAREALPQAKALYRAGLVDAEVSGELDDYLESFGTAGAVPRPFNLLDTYRYLHHLSQQAAAQEGELQQATSGSEYERSAPDEPTVRAVPKVGRNEPCPCGSGRKYKRCHGRPGR